MLNYRKRIYTNYIGTQFGDAHPTGAIEKEYEVHARYFERNYRPYLPANNDAAIVDIGCGLGHFLNFAKRTGYTDVTGVDASPDIAAFCREKGFTVVEQDFTEYLLAHPSRFDCVVMNDAIEHLTKEEIIDFLDAVLASLKSGGRFLVKTPNMANGFLAGSGRYIDFTHEIGFTEVSMREVLSACGFRNIAITGTDIYVFYANPLNYPAKFAAFLFSNLHYLVNWLYGRTTIKIFDKDILAAAYK